SSFPSSCSLERKIGSPGIMDLPDVSEGRYGRGAQAGILIPMPDRATHILCINGGSSSIKYASFDLKRPEQRLLSGHLGGIGVAGGLSFAAGIEQVLAQVAQQADLPALAAAAHRVVHGGPMFGSHRRIDDSVLAE